MYICGCTYQYIACIYVCTCVAKQMLNQNLVRLQLMMQVIIEH